MKTKEEIEEKLEYAELNLANNSDLDYEYVDEYWNGFVAALEWVLDGVKEDVNHE